MGGRGAWDQESALLDPDRLAAIVCSQTFATAEPTVTGYFNVPPEAATDFNADGVIHADDLGDFITAYFNGCY